MARQIVQFDFDEEALARLEGMVVQLNAKNKAQVVQKALRLLEWLLEESQLSSVQLLDNKEHVLSSASKDHLLK